MLAICYCSFIHVKYILIVCISVNRLYAGTLQAPVAEVETSVRMVGKETTGIVRVRIVITDVVVADMVEDMIGRSKGVWSDDSTASLKPGRVPTDSNFSGIGSFLFIFFLPFQNVNHVHMINGRNFMAWTPD